jgi:hypothetical protein
MTSSKDYAKRIDDVMDSAKELKATSVPEAKLVLKQIGQVKRELQLIKKEINLEKKNLRSAYTTAKVKVGKGGFGQGVLQGLFGKKTMGSINAAQREDIRRKERAQIAPYEHLTQHIDKCLLALDAYRVSIETLLAEQVSSK